MDLRRQARIVRAWLWLLIASLLLVIEAGRTRRAAAGHGREALARAGARVLGAGLYRISARAGSDCVYFYDYYRAYGTEAAAKVGPQGASASGPPADKRG